VPVSPQVGSQFGDDHEVTNPGPDVLVAAGAEVGLDGLVRLDGTHLVTIGGGLGGVGPQPRTAQPTSSTHTRTASATRT